MTTTVGGLDVLVLEDDAADSTLLAVKLKACSAKQVPFRHAWTLGQALEEVRKKAPDIAFVDLHVPDSRGPETVSKLLDVAPGLPIVVLTGLDDEKSALEAMRRGAQEYLVKGEFSAPVLRKTIRYAIERQRLFSELRQSKEKELEIKDRFLSHVSHELRTPLNALFQFLSILLDGLGGPLNESQKEYADIAMRNAKQLERMIGDLMDVTRLSNDKLVFNPEMVEVDGVVQHCVEALAGAAAHGGITLEASVDDALPLVIADPTRTRQVISNLVENAIKFTPEGGAIRVVASALPDHVEIAVEDTGPGLDADALNRVFDRLWQNEEDHKSSRKGLGLGLFISRQIVLRQGGEIQAERRDEGGSRFRFTIPTYSLGRLVAETMAQAEDEHLAILSIGVTSIHKGAGAESTARALRHIRSTIEKNIRSATDVIAPPETGDEGTVYVRVLGPTNEGGAEAMAQRIEQALETDCALWRDEFATTTASAELRLDRRGTANGFTNDEYTGDDPEDLVRDVLTRLDTSASNGGTRE